MASNQVPKKDQLIHDWVRLGWVVLICWILIEIKK